MTDGTPGSPWTLHLGDCLPFLRSLPDKSVDHVITDPPYEAEAHTQGRRMMAGAGGRMRDGARIYSAPLDFAPISADVRTEVGHHLARCASRWIVVFCQAEAVAAWRESLEAGGAKWKRACVWIKPNGQPQLTGDRPGMGYESIACAHAPGRSRWNAGGKHGVYTFPMDANFSRFAREHPTQKPTPLFESLVRDFTDPGETILDPFAGSGTTGVAALKLGRRFIGCELSPKYHAVALKRLSNAREQLGLWTGAA